MKRLAFRAGFSLSDFYHPFCTATDIFIALEAEYQRSNHWLEIVAWHAANIMNSLQGKKGKTITPNDLLGKKKSHKKFKDEMLERAWRLKMEDCKESDKRGK